MADKKCRQAIHRFAKLYPEASIVVTGCYAQLKSGEISAMPGVAVVAGTDRKMSLPDYIDAWLKEKEGKGVTHVTPTPDIVKFEPSCSRGDRTRYFLDVYKRQPRILWQRISLPKLVFSYLQLKMVIKTHSGFYYHIVLRITEAGMHYCRIS